MTFQSESAPLVELTDGTRTMSVGVSGRTQFNERFVRAWHGEHAGNRPGPFRSTT